MTIGGRAVFDRAPSAGTACRSVDAACADIGIGCPASNAARQKVAGICTSAALALMLAGCGADPNTDVKQWMDEQSKSMKGKVEPFPQVKPYVPFAYNAFDLPDPFKPRKIEPARAGTNKFAPDLTRRKEPLEAYPIESLRMVGTLERGGTMYALVRASDRTVYQVRPGNYMGQNFGVITSISESDIKLRELVQDSSGDWAERQTRLLLDDQEQKK